MKRTLLVNVTIRESGAPLPAVAVVVRDARSGPGSAPLGSGSTSDTGVLRLVVDLPALAPGRFAAGRLTTGLGSAKSGTGGALLLTVVDAKGLTVQETSYPVPAGRNAIELAVPIPGTVALSHELVARKTRPNVDVKERQFLDDWAKRMATDPGPGPGIDVCLGSLLLNTLVGSARPTSRLHKEAAKALNSALPAKQIPQIRSRAKAARSLLQKVDYPRGKPCASWGQPADIAATLMAAGGPLDAVTQALTESAPAPDQDLGTPTAGLPFLSAFSSWEKTCTTNFSRGGLRGTGRKQMNDWYPNGLMLLAPPRINRVDVYEPTLVNYVRHATPADKNLDIRDLDPVRGWQSMTVPMGLLLDDDAVLVLQEDPADGGRQILVTDVAAGQKVRLLGSGFVNDSVQIHARFALWTGLSDGGRLIPDHVFSPVFGWDGKDLPVYGASEHENGDTPENFLGDRIVFDWPSQASEPGLYRLTFEFKNPEHLPTSAEQDPMSCKVSLESPDTLSTTLWFAVLPPLDPARTRVRATTVRCVDETDPERIVFNLFDDVTYSASGQITRQVIDRRIPPNLILESLLSNTVEGEHWFWSDGDEWTPNLDILPLAPDVFRTLQLDEFINVTLLASEIEGEADRIILRALVIALLVIILILVVVVAIAVVVALVALDLISGGTATAIVGVVAVIVGVLFGALLTGAIVAIQAFFASIPSGAPLGVVMPIFSGPEVAHLLSPVRFHRMLWFRERPSLPNTGISIHRETSVSANAISESYQCDATALGGVYTLGLVIDTP